MTKEIELTKGYVALVDESDHAWLSQWKWCALTNRSGPFAVRHKEGTNSAVIYMHRAIVDAPSDMVVDHANHHTLDNRRSNLRLCTHRQNSQNQKRRARSTTGFKGVSWRKHEQRWQAHIGIDGKHTHIGYFDDPIDAARAYDALARLYFGKFALLNFPDE